MCFSSLVLILAPYVITYLALIPTTATMFLYFPQNLSQQTRYDNYIHNTTCRMYRTDRSTSKGVIQRTSFSLIFFTGEIKTVTQVNSSSDIIYSVYFWKSVSLNLKKERDYFTYRLLTFSISWRHQHTCTRDVSLFHSGLYWNIITTWEESGIPKKKKKVNPVLMKLTYAYFNRLITTRNTSSFLWFGFFFYVFAVFLYRERLITLVVGQFRV